ncbi:uroporphyrinogen-III synthase [Alteromonas sp. ASW11-19]|uniref:Uroporphyrinogen-III synthase n=1 Tax=Alteromonas salexigens TaxID=2982530 RepID=A0ABT2VN78_9ALTE|nr:uroporphyrinogen-III synthase [Alteromonas salexigens]MCU7554767.1 uroporphyrinogen-III synthase [Alteromonas salexigens]
MYLITRPRPKLNATATAFTEAGLTAAVIATSDIDYCQPDIDALRQRLQAEPPQTPLVVTSVFAAQVLLDLPAQYIAKRHIVAVGDATARALAQCNTVIVIPQPQTSEGVLALPALSAAQCRSVVIIKGEGGRTAIADTLISRGIAVAAYCVYRRVRLAEPIQSNHWQWSHVKGIIATSEEMASQLWQQAPQAQAAALPWLTVSERVACAIRALGVKDVAVSAGASDHALIKWVKEFWE